MGWFILGEQKNDNQTSIIELVNEWMAEQIHIYVYMCIEIDGWMNKWMDCMDEFEWMNIDERMQRTNGWMDG